MMNEKSIQKKLFVKSKKPDVSGVAPLYNDQDDICSYPLTESKNLINIFNLRLRMKTSASCQG